MDLNAGCFRVPADKITRLKSAIHSITTRGNKVAVRFLASVIISMRLAVGPVSRLRTRAMYAVLNQRRFWSDCIREPCPWMLLMSCNFGSKALISLMGGRFILLLVLLEWIFLMPVALDMVGTRWSWVRSIHKGSGQQMSLCLVPHEGS